MNNKEQIIINGVDVCECRNFDKESYKLDVYDCDLNELHGYCSCNNDCYFKQLVRKTQEYNELALQIRETQEYSDTCADCKVDEYKKALEEIEEVCIKDTRKFADGTELRYDSLDDILDIINKAKGEE